MNKEFIRFLSTGRLARYDLPSDTPEVTIERYQWNVRLAEAMMPALGYVEIGLRNHLNVAICHYYGERWLLEPPRALRLRQNDLDKIRAHHNEVRHEKRGEPTNDDLVAKMNFGFWCSLLQKQYDPALWHQPQAMSLVFPHMPRMQRARQQISPKLQLVRFARNCIAHHEPIWDLEPDIKIIHDTCLELVRGMSLSVAHSLEEAVDRFDTVYDEGKHLLKLSQDQHAPQKSLTPLMIEIEAASWNKIEGLAKRLEKATAETLAMLPAPLQPVAQRCAFTLLLTTDGAVKKLNRDWRGKDKATNILSFPHFELKELRAMGRDEDKMDLALAVGDKGKKARLYVGDMAVAYHYMSVEAKEEHKILLDHLTHLMIHGILHIFGYDHIVAADAVKMEKMEKKIMGVLGLCDPYEPCVVAKAKKGGMRLKKMSDPVSVLSQGTAYDKEEPRSWLRNLWVHVRRNWQDSPEVEALREAVEDLIEADPMPSGAPLAEQTLLTNILNLRTREAVDCMIPRADIKAIDLGCSLQELVALMAACKHSRIPVYRDTLDDVVGMVHMKDIMLCLAEKKTCIVRDLIRPILIVVPSMPASKLLLQMRTTRQHMAIVVDEFGGVDGLITIEDLVEEIVGEIDDEHDAPSTNDIIARPDGTLLIDARLPIEEFEQRVGEVLLSPEEREEIDTLGGFVFHVAGHVPKIGETIKCRAGFAFEILEADQSRIKRVRVRRYGEEKEGLS